MLATKIVLWLTDNYASVGNVRKGNLLFNDTLNSFYLWIFGTTFMVKISADSKRGNPLPPLYGLCHKIIVGNVYKLYACIN